MKLSSLHSRPQLTRGPGAPANPGLLLHLMPTSTHTRIITPIWSTWTESSQPCECYPHPGQGESESSLSEDSPASSSLSSDSDESGGLVWPQQLPPQLSSPLTATAPAGAPLQPKAFVKIKASHALKKKILRFRTGSLKVMTTV
ncbi:unnamed protein product [Oncorhynchus mykiss]|uniref:Uncharacterized protein n=1 Tax=Oncorhynchus mykiss TaxID=8022 RepID=A0A060YGB2_ONCMY|nr:unnamed protein product [Oncorhynchus mykiss]